MKKTLLQAFFLISLSTPTFADTAKTVIGSFQGKLSLVDEKLNIQKIEVEVVNQFCNFWGTTCAGGPRDASTLPIVLTESTDGKSISFVNETEYEHSSLKVGNRFSSCKVNLIVQGVNDEGRSLTGSHSLAWINQKEICASKEKLTAIVRENLKKTLTVKDGGIYISIK